MSVLSVDTPVNVAAEASLEDGFVIIEGLAPELTDWSETELASSSSRRPSFSEPGS